jgi:hypothetical protein
MPSRVSKNLLPLQHGDRSSLLGISLPLPIGIFADFVHGEMGKYQEKKSSQKKAATGGNRLEQSLKLRLPER